MTTKSEYARAQAVEDWHREHETSVSLFLEAVSDCPLMYAATKPEVRHAAQRDRDNTACAALMNILSDFRAKKAQTPQERAVGAWLDSICRENVERMVDKADDRGDFLEVAR